MERAVVSSRKTLLVLTPEYIPSEWAEIENIMVQTLDPANRELRLIPLLKADCKKPLRIGTSRTSTSPTARTSISPGGSFSPRWARRRNRPRRQQPQRDDWFLAHPYPMPPNFTGRIAERDDARHWLDADAAHPLLSPARAGRLRQERARLALADARRGARRLAARRLVELLRRRRQLRQFPGQRRCNICPAGRSMRSQLPPAGYWRRS